jgi:inner membrane protein
MALTAQSASVKAAALTAIALLLVVPLSLLGTLVAARSSERDAAVRSVARGWGDRQWISGPVLAIPVTRDSEPARTFDWYVLPDKLDITAGLLVQDTRRRLGLYDVPVYVTRVRAKGEFDLAREIARLAGGATALHPHLEQARVLLPINDPRGLRDLFSGVPGFEGFEPSATGFPIPVLAAPVNLAEDSWAAPRAFDLSFEVAGTQSLKFLPLARVMRVEAHGNWADPGFADGFLPTQRRIDARGFTASWQLLNLNRSYGDRWFQGSTSADTLLESGFGVELLQPVDIYQRSTRAVKYGGFFVALSFLTLFLVESLQRSPVHPIQYGLMGLALSVFYLLLLALSEHIGFVLAYALATAALCSLMGVYLAAALQSRRAGLVAAAIFAATYALLYLLVTSENYALLAGSLALFGLLATAMYLTRKIDWYARETTGPLSQHLEPGQ